MKYVLFKSNSIFNKRKKFRYLFKILSWIYGIIVYLRNYFYDNKWLSSTHFSIPIICIGNLNSGGTGKTPHIEYLIRLIKNIYKVGVISRGYKRKTKGFILANKYSTYKNIGDESLQYFKKFGNKINVAVDENRVHGIKKLCNNIKIDIILLDDAFQHRSIQAGLNILLTDFYNLYSEDNLLPVGNLRENKNQAKRADIIIITKCPNNINKFLKRKIIKKLQPEKKQKIFFSFIKYSKYLINNFGIRIPISILKKKKVLLITGIAQYNPLIKFLKKKCNKIIHFCYQDHHKFQTKDYLKINKIFNNLIGEKIILTTEKDFMRIKVIHLQCKNIFYIPIFITIDNKNIFDQKILNYVKSIKKSKKIL